MTKSERIEQLEREVANLRAEMALLAARPAYVPTHPPQTCRPWTWPNMPYQVWCSTATPLNVCAA